MNSRSYHNTSKSIPPRLDLSQLTSEELEHLNRVLKKQEEFESKFKENRAKSTLFSVEAPIAKYLRTPFNVDNNALSSEPSTASTTSSLKSKFSFSFKFSKKVDEKVDSTNILNQISNYRNITRVIDGVVTSPTDLNTANVNRNTSKVVKQNKTSFNSLPIATSINMSRSTPNTPLVPRNKLNANCCFICKKQTNARLDSSDIILTQCVECSNFVCQKCGEKTSSSDAEFKDTWRCKQCSQSIKKEEDKTSLWSFGLKYSNLNDRSKSFKRIFNNISSKFNTSANNSSNANSQNEFENILNPILIPNYYLFQPKNHIKIFKETQLSAPIINKDLSYSPSLSSNNNEISTNSLTLNSIEESSKASVESLPIAMDNNTDKKKTTLAEFRSKSKSNETVNPNNKQVLDLTNLNNSDTLTIVSDVSNKSTGLVNNRNKSNLSNEKTSISSLKTSDQEITKEDSSNSNAQEPTIKLSKNNLVKFKGEDNNETLPNSSKNDLDKKESIKVKRSSFKNNNKKSSTKSKDKTSQNDSQIGDDQSSSNNNENSFKNTSSLQQIKKSKGWSRIVEITKQLKMSKSQRKLTQMSSIDSCMDSQIDSRTAQCGNNRRMSLNDDGNLKRIAQTSSSNAIDSEKSIKTISKSHTKSGFFNTINEEEKQTDHSSKSGSNPLNIINRNQGSVQIIQRAPHRLNRNKDQDKTIKADSPPLSPSPQPVNSTPEQPLVSNTSSENDVPRRKKKYKRSFSNDTKSTTKINEKNYKQQRSVDKITNQQIIDNLADLAKVILIEHKKTIKKQIIIGDSFTTNSTSSSNHSRQDTCSSHKESNSSMNEGELVRRAAKELSIRNSIKERNHKENLLNSEKWHKRRLGLMRNSKKWSNAVDETDDNLLNNVSVVTNSSINSNSNIANSNSNSASISNYEESIGTGVPSNFNDDDCSSNSSSSQINIKTQSSKYYSNKRIDDVVSGTLANSNFNSSTSRKNSSIFTSYNHRTVQISISNKNLNYNYSNFNNELIIKQIDSNDLHKTNSRKLPEIPLAVKENMNAQRQIEHKLFLTKFDAKEIKKDEPVIANKSINLEVATNKSTSTSENTKEKIKKTKSKSFDGSQHQDLENNLVIGNQATINNSSKSRDSINSIKKSKDNRLTFSSVDVTGKRYSSLVIFDQIPSNQRSIDYPSIVRKNPNLSEIVRKRLLFEKISKGVSLYGESLSNSFEKEHIPKSARKIVIRKDNSIEIKLRRPPKIRTHAASLESFNPIVQATQEPLRSVNQDLLQPTANNSIVKNPSMLSVSSNGSDRRKTIETCENIFAQSEENAKLRAKSSPTNLHRILLYKDKSDRSVRTNGLGMIMIAGYECEDGSLGCFVKSVIKGGPADMNNIEVGDQILEFDGHSLIDSKYEELRVLQNDNSVGYVQLVVLHNNVITRNNSTNNSLQISRNYQTLPRLCQSLTNKRRNLPPMPPQMHPPTNKLNNNEMKKDYSIAETLVVPTNSLLKPILINRGRLLIQIWDDFKHSKLAITINHANNMPPRSESEKWYTFVAGRLVFEEETINMFKSAPILAEHQQWNETFLFEYNQKLDDITLELCVYDSLSPDDTRLLRENFIGMIVLPLDEANLDDEPRWYELRDKQNRKNSTASVTFKSSSNEESLDSLCEKKKKIVNIISGKHMSRKSTLFASNNKIDSPDKHENSSVSPINKKKSQSVRKLSQALARFFLRRGSESSARDKIIIHSSIDDEYEKISRAVSSDRKSRDSFGKRNKQRRHTAELLSVNFLVPSSSGTSRKSSNASNEDIDRYFSLQQTMKLNDPSPGLGQIAPKGEHKDEIVMACIKLGFVMSKGQLEIFVFEARNLKYGPYKEVYVKTYLRIGTNKLNKKKTHSVRNSSEPVFNAKLCYKACNVSGRRIQIVLISEKPMRLENECIGEAIIQLDSLDLSQQSISWYKLYKQHLIENDFYDST